MPTAPAPMPSAPAAAQAVDMALSLLRDSLRIADAAVLADVESGAVPVHIDGARWHDTRPMLDPREHCDDVLEMTRLALGYAIARGLVERHAAQGHLVRVRPDAEAKRTATARTEG